MSAILAEVEAPGSGKTPRSDVVPGTKTQRIALIYLI
jgi:hypothetical protein